MRGFPVVLVAYDIMEDRGVGPSGSVAHPARTFEKSREKNWPGVTRDRLSRLIPRTVPGYSVPGTQVLHPSVVSKGEVYNTKSTCTRTTVVLVPVVFCSCRLSRTSPRVF